MAPSGAATRSGWVANRNGAGEVPEAKAALEPEAQAAAADEPSSRGKDPPGPPPGKPAPASGRAQPTSPIRRAGS